MNEQTHAHPPSVLGSAGEGQVRGWLQVLVTDHFVPTE